MEVLKWVQLKASVFGRSQSRVGWWRSPIPQNVRFQHLLLAVVLPNGVVVVPKVGSGCSCKPLADLLIKRGSIIRITLRSGVSAPPVPPTMLSMSSDSEFDGTVAGVRQTNPTVESSALSYLAGCGKEEGIWRVWVLAQGKNRDKNCRGAPIPWTRMNSLQFSGPSDFDPFYFTGMTSDADLNRAAADLAVFDRRKTPLRRIGVRPKDRPAERTSHLDLFFEVHRKILTRKTETTRSFFGSGEFFFGQLPHYARH